MDLEQISKKTKTPLQTLELSINLPSGPLPLNAYATRFFIWSMTKGFKKVVDINTLKANRGNLDNHIFPATEGWIVGEITSFMIEQVCENWYRNSNLRTATVNTIIRTFRKYIKFVYTIHFNQSTSPFDSVRDFAIRPDEIEDKPVLTTDEVHSILETIKERRPDYFAPFVFLAFTGARVGEVTALEWKSVNREKNSFFYEYHQTDGIRKKGTKTGIRVEVPLLPTLKRALDFHGDIVRNAKIAVRQDLVFPELKRRKNHGYLSRFTLNKIIKDTCKYLKMEERSTKDFRKFFNTEILSSGVHPELVRAMTGHVTEEMTHHYAHISLETKFETLSKLEAKINIDT